MKKKIIPIVCMVTLLLPRWTGTPASAAEPVTAPAEFRLVAPWELSGPVVIVWPERLSGGRRLIPNTLELIHALPDPVDVALAAERPPRIRWVPDMGRDTRYLPVTTARSHAIGTWAGLAAATPEGRLISLRFQLPVHSVESRERSNRRDNHEAARQLGRLLYGDTSEEVPLRLSPLHLTHNGRGVALVSNRVISENEHLSLTEIRERLRTHAGLHTIIFIPVSPTEPLGYVDGQVRFVSHDQILVSEPLPNDRTHREQHRDLMRLLDQQLDPAIQRIRVPRPSAPPVLNASYLHLLHAGSVLLYPQFDAPEDQPVRQLLERLLPDADILPFPLPDHPLNRIAIWR